MNVLSLICVPLKILHNHDDFALEENQVRFKILEIGLKDLQGECVGNEVIGQVLEIGTAVQELEPGDLVVLARREDKDHKSMPISLEMEVYGIEEQQALVRVPPELATCAVLLYELAHLEGAIRDSLAIQRARFQEPAETPSVLVVGLGLQGLLATMLLRLHHAHVYGLESSSSADSLHFFQALGGQLIAEQEELKVDLCIVGEVERMPIQWLDFLKDKGLFLVMQPQGFFEAHANSFLQHLLNKNQLLMGSSGGTQEDWQLAIEDLSWAQEKWGGLLSQFIRRLSSKEIFIKEQPFEKTVLCLNNKSSHSTFPKA